MSHAHHFLSRLSRLSLQQGDLALALYRDPSLVRGILAAARLPDGVRRVALALDQTERPPHLLVERDGSFVTCLGTGMEVRDAAVIDRRRMDALQADANDLRRLRERALASEFAPPATMKRLLEAGAWLSREEMREAIALAPLFEPVLGDVIYDLADGWRRGRETLLCQRNLDRCSRTRNGEQLLRIEWQTCWALAHLAVLLGSPQFERPDRDIDAGVVAAFFGELASSGNAGILIRGAWALAQMGEPVLETTEQRWLQPASQAEMNGAGFALAALAHAQPRLRDRALATLQRPPSTGQVGEQTERLEKSSGALRNALLLGFESSAQMDCELVGLGRQIAWNRVRHFGRPGWASVDHVPAAVARAAASLCQGHPFRDETGFCALIASAQWLGQARAEDLYLPAAELPRLEEPWTIGLGLGMVRAMSPLGPRVPARRDEKALGRNERCRCGSEKKFKRCCGR